VGVGGAAERVQQLHDREGRIRFEGVVQRMGIAAERLVNGAVARPDGVGAVDVDRRGGGVGNRRQRHAVAHELAVRTVNSAHRGVGTTGNHHTVPAAAEGRLPTISPAIIRSAPRLNISTRMPADQSSQDALEALIQRCLQGDQAAWEAIVRQHWRKEFNVAYKFVAKHEEAEDLTQEIFLKVFKSLDTFDRRANFQTWLISVSRNLCIDHYRSVRKERQMIDRDVDANELAPPSRDAGPMAALEQRDRVSLLRQALAALPETLRTAVLMRDIRELSYQEIAD